MDYLKEILEFSNQLNFKNLHFQNEERLKISSKPDGVIITGMGGSGLPSNFIANLGIEIGLKKPIVSSKDYNLNPSWKSFKNPFFVFISFSGNTEETISGLNFLLKKKNRSPLAVITKGGKLKNIAEKFKLPLVTFEPKNLTPRQAIGYNYYALVKVLRSVFPEISSKDLSQEINVSSLKNSARALAKRIKSKIVLIYTDPSYSHVGYAWKTNINETAKLPAFNNTFPEIFHNEITCFEKNIFPFFAIFIIDPKNQNKNILKKINVASKILNSKKVETIILNLKGKNAEEKTWNSVVLSHLTSFYLAEINKVNPKETKLINKFKELLTKTN